MEFVEGCAVQEGVVGESLLGCGSVGTQGLVHARRDDDEVACEAGERDAEEGSSCEQAES